MGFWSNIFASFRTLKAADLQPLREECEKNLRRIRFLSKKDYTYDGDYGLVSTDDRYTNMKTFYEFAHPVPCEDLRVSQERLTKLAKESGDYMERLEYVNELRHQHSIRFSKQAIYSSILKSLRDDPMMIGIMRAIKKSGPSFDQLFTVGNETGPTFTDKDGRIYEADAIVAIVLDVPMWMANMLLLKDTRFQDGVNPLFKVHNSEVTNAMMIAVFTSLLRGVQPQTILSPPPVYKQKPRVKYVSGPSRDPYERQRVSSGGRSSSDNLHDNHMQMAMMHVALSDSSSSSSSSCSDSSSSSDFGGSCSSDSSSF